MFDSRTVSVARPRGALLGQVLGLLAFSMLFTAGGALLAPMIGPSSLIIGIIGGLVTLLVLVFARSLAPTIRLGLFYLFTTFEGMTIGLLLSAYIAAGLGNIVVLAGGTTGGLVFALSAYAWTTKRDLSGWGSFLFMGLIGLVLASLIGFFVAAPLFHLVIAAVTAILFSGYVLYDVQNLKYARHGDDPIGYAIGIYLDILNLFLAILRILTYFMASDD